MRGGDDAGIVRQVEVIVGSEVDQRPAITDEASGREVAPHAKILKADGTSVRTVDSGPEPTPADPKGVRREIVTIPARDGFPKKVKPLVRLGERETAAYCVLRGIDYQVEECPMAEGNKHLGYKDALSHLLIGRRLVVGQHPGFGQLGGIWLPLPHLLIATLAWNRDLYLSGLAGSVFSMLAYVGTVVGLYAAVRVATRDRLAGWVAAAVYGLNANALYLQSTPMGETLRFAGTMEVGGLDLSINQARVNGILKAIPKYFPDFGPDDLRDLPVWSGLRPCSPDGLPYIGRFRRYANLTAATGHSMMGVSLGPITGKLVGELLSGEKPEIDLAALNPDRYA